ncbi:MAG: MBL fold metallo-hydrolase [Alphaproteobacteria bacterium]|nr:MBL fold metallo-hydrolase [Alphaproteobacteria bacterium]
MLRTLSQSLLAVSATVLIFAVAPATKAQDVKREITNMAGDLYRFQNKFHFSVFLVTPDGVIATDPINAEAAAWLKDEIAKRFQAEVKYVIYSHDHADHSSGGEVFAPTATFIAHDNARKTILGEGRPTPVPDISFSDSMTIELGGKVVELTYVGRNHSDNMIVMSFPAERALFAVDFIPIRTLAFRDLPDGYVPDWIDSLRTVETMDFDILIPGHGPVGSKADVTAFREYMTDLTDAVLTAMRDGQSLDEMKQSIKLDKYKDWGQYEAWLPMNIEGAYNRMVLHHRGN